jgi:hypothetical protein
MAEQMTLNFDNLILDREEEAVWMAMQARRGKGNEIGGRDIARKTGLEYDRVREVIAHLVTGHHRLIGSNSRGYYVPVTAQEVSEVTRSLRHRGIMILVRAARLQKTSLEEIFHQGRLELEKEGTL